VVTKQRNFEIEWAEIHLNALNAHYSSLLSKPENLYRVTAEEDTKRGFLIIKGESIGMVGILKLGLIAGDFVCNLRGSLDHLAWTLAKLGKRRPSSETCFPVCIKDGTHTQAKIAAATAGMPIGAVAAVKSFQPYNSGNAYKTHPLWRLNFLWNANKHRIIGLHSVNSGVLFEVAKGVPIIEERKFQDHGIVTIPLSAKDKVRLNPRPNTEIFFGDEERGVQLSIQDLRDIYQFVSLKVSPALSCFLP
jgi:hypothetical protein